jgi:hypothetical protein
MKLTNALIILFFVVTSSNASGVEAFHPISNDTTKVAVRSFDGTTIQRFKNASAYQYSRPQQGLTAWQRFWMWVGLLVARFLYFVSQTVIGQVIFYSAAGLLILYVILKIMRIDIRNLFYRSSASAGIAFKTEEANIHDLDFEKLIREAVDKKQFRDAVRLIFLRALKMLSEEQLIRWLPGKTNDEYLFELRQHPAGPRLRELRYYFDYAWYGHFEINGQTYEAVHKTFTEFKALIN